MRSQIYLVALTLALLTAPARAQPAGADRALVEQGRYLAAAGDCSACHGATFKGGDAVSTPIGAVYASNITPDQANGIGAWSLQQFSDALRKGRSPGEHLYPAMPYTAYTGLGDAEVQALYSYFMLGVKAVPSKPPTTDLPFPFVRAAMVPWNWLFLSEGKPTGAVPVEGAQRLRGSQLIETLGHCSACHTPRGALMQELADKHLAGATVGGWWAPDITPDPTGIGGWSDEKLVTFLRTGHTDVAVAAGAMGTVVSRSLSQLTPGDIDAAVAYLRALPRVATQQLARSDTTKASVLDVSAIERVADPSDWRGQLEHGTREGSVLYQSACASCHGVDGRGSAKLVFPSLHLINSVSAANASTLVQVIAHGVDRSVGDRHALMPSFRTSLDDAQIASIANHVRVAFGGVKSDLSETDVAGILRSGSTNSWLIKNAKPLALGVIVALMLFVSYIGWLGWRAVSRRSSTSRPVP